MSHLSATDLDAESHACSDFKGHQIPCWFRIQKSDITTKEASHLSATNLDAESLASSDFKGAETTKGVSRLSATERRTTKSLFEGLGSNKGKRQKHLSSLPLPDAWPLPKRKCGTPHATLTSYALLHTYILAVALLKFIHDLPTFTFCHSDVF